MAISSLYRVTYHFEKNGKRVSDTLQDTVLVSSGDINTITAALTNNGRTNNGVGSIVFDGGNHIHGAVLS